MGESIRLPIANRPTVHLSKGLLPLEEWLNSPDVVEIVLNRPCEIWVERLGVPAMRRFDVPQMDEAAIRFLAERVAGYSEQSISEETPLLSAALPGGERFQAVLSPAAPQGGAFSIRKQVVKDLSLADFERMGAFEGTAVSDDDAISDTDDHLCQRLAAGDRRGFIELAIRERVSILLSGGTSTGKTTALNALLKEVPTDDRILTIEDTRELRPPQLNYLPLVASKGDQGRARVTVQGLLEASLRMRPDRIILGEIRGEEAFTFLQAINSGHPGSLSTIHADSPSGAYEALALKVLMSGTGLSKEEIISYIRQVLPVVIQLRRDGGVRRWSEIYFHKFADWKRRQGGSQ
ncbi:P-type DNA transfer ATPase VirB11 [Rhizobium sp. VS19-DR104.2]|uniref:P-type DNA transfer ATPase VirB11 n=1 Tax=unclassified Rhizobium TaxID=2613769 RepID=UPI001CC44BA7|nr:MULTISPECIES: P-type DNA transfer ATPase VirB11 [unclassified Rhizobium]MBZ5762280.1 P-type DNA transfer ATPase VirB11 [Rhizobium sp. VS19-DR96]MBZ5768296.1 P-type DNA transfer ATPase VirB11 [Rhizobium sp. VS19-DR129.2]MBZ5775832.1 P-type DNA transfer ATPase VirB11 [Rhizobium sp. VS19-DRK62.2]MBZ5787147.1 P-type DNA transfer ATPase VirB11 [Rhizobium sp. VS19-DR121]MBZ5804222.1 P-type DNA transfer ATPase VirB11 [Rhizobium sp. VS19-DR181]